MLTSLMVLWNKPSGEWILKVNHAHDGSLEQLCLPKQLDGLFAAPKVKEWPAPLHLWLAYPDKLTLSLTNHRPSGLNLTRAWESWQWKSKMLNFSTKGICFVVNIMRFFSTSSSSFDKNSIQHFHCQHFFTIFIYAACFCKQDYNKQKTQRSKTMNTRAA